MRGMKPKGKVKIAWSPEFAYAIGLIASDGCLSPDGRHIIFVSKDIDLIETFKRCLGIDNKHRVKRGEGKGWAYDLAFGDVLFYRFLESIGFMPRKSKVMSRIDVPWKYFPDFFRGCFDGDGSFMSYYDPRWPSSFMCYTTLASASADFVDWVRATLAMLIGVRGHVTMDGRKVCYQLKYAKRESLDVLRMMYYTPSVPHLLRKRLKVLAAMRIMGERLPGL